MKMKHMNIFAQFQDFQKFKKLKKKATKKHKHSDNDNIDSESSYLQSSFKHHVSGQKRQKVIPTTEVVGELTTNGVKKPIIILINTGRSSTIVLKKFVYKNQRVKDKKSVTEWTTLGGSSFTKKKGHIYI
jgi:hypothetical protein